MKRFIPRLLPAFFLLFSSGISFAPTSLNAQELFFTYLGVTAGGGVQTVHYENWWDDQRQEQNYQGNFFSGGALMNIIVNNLVGEFTAQFMHNSLEGTPDLSVHHTLLTVTGKYMYELSTVFNLTGGAGLYIDMPPATDTYDGGGGLSACVGTMIDLTLDSILVLDIYGRYGYFGLGEESTRLTTGASLGFVYKIGRI